MYIQFNWLNSSVSEKVDSWAPAQTSAAESWEWGPEICVCDKLLFDSNLC